MTTVYGAWVPNSTTTARMRLRCDYTVPTPSAGQTSITVTGTVYIEVRYGLSDSNNTFTWGGTLIAAGSSSKNINVATDGAQSLHTFSQAVTLSSGTQSKSLSFTLRGVEYVGSSNVAQLNFNVTIPAKVVNPPAAPSAFNFARVSDTRHDATWSATSTSTAPIDSFEIGRYRKGSGTTDYPIIATVSGSARAWSDTSTIANDVYDWRIRSVNAAGVSAWTYPPNDVWTTPAAATNVQLVKSGTDVTVSWTINARDATHQDLRIKSSSDGGLTWSAYSWIPGHTAFGPTINSRVVSGLSGAQIHKIGVVSAVTTPTTLYGYSADSAALQLLTPPLAPLILGPSGVISTQQAAVFLWDHQPVDSTAQTAAEVRHQPAGGSWTTASVATAETFTRAAGYFSPGVIEYQVRTKGQHATYGPWSSTYSFTVAAPPAVTINTPAGGAAISSNRLTLGISFSDPQGAAMTGWTADLYQGATLLESRSGIGSTSSIAFNTLLADSTAISANVRATSGTGLTSAIATWSGTTDFLEPPAPSITGVWSEEDGVTTLAINNPMGNGTTTSNPVSARIERTIDEGETWQIVADGLPINAGLGDDQVSLNTNAWYRVFSISAQGTETASSVIQVLTDTKKVVWLNSLDGQTRVKLYYNLSVSWSEPNDVVFEDYFGDKYPTEHIGIREHLNITVSAVLMNQESIWALQQLKKQRFIYRDFDGQTMTVVMDPSGIARARGIKVLRPVTLQLTKVGD